MILNLTFNVFDMFERPVKTCRYLTLKRNKKTILRLVGIILAL